MITVSPSAQICSLNESLPLSCYEVDCYLCILCIICPTQIWSCMHHDRLCHNNHYSYLFLFHINRHIPYPVLIREIGHIVDTTSCGKRQRSDRAGDASNRHHLLFSACAHSLFCIVGPKPSMLVVVWRQLDVV